MSEAAELLVKIRKDLREMEEATDEMLWPFARPIETVDQYRQRKIDTYKGIIKALEGITK